METLVDWWGVLAMKTLTRHLVFNIPARMDFLNITPDVESLVEIMRAAYRSSSGERSRLVEKSLDVARRFTWRRSASGVLSGIEKCLKKR